MDRAYAFFASRPDIEANWQLADDHDLAFFRAIIPAENARNPGLNLHFASSVKDMNHIVQSSEGRIRFILKQPQSPDFPDNEHYIAVEVLKTRNTNSYIFVDNLPVDSVTYQSQWAVHLISEQLPANSSGTYFTTGQQKGNSGCIIWANSFALKMHDETTAMARIHQDNIDRYPHENEAAQVEEKDGVGVLPAKFFKHAESRQTIKDVIRSLGGEDPVVNKKNQTLMERHLSLRNGPEGRSTSIENKRLVFLHRVRAHLAESEQ